ncbi:hypothetical protein RB195_025638 [Necator americanus]|uniref:Phlebovirus glycoprotein G2 fusion domain-containing protein n=1 Tax=Necator americanus TaxID=51031 RepID=A0ABR1ET71_NECAM
MDDEMSFIIIREPNCHLSQKRELDSEDLGGGGLLRRSWLDAWRDAFPTKPYAPPCGHCQCATIPTCACQGSRSIEPIIDHISNGAVVTCSHPFYPVTMECRTGDNWIEEDLVHTDNKIH